MCKLCIQITVYKGVNDQASLGEGGRCVISRPTHHLLINPKPKITKGS